MTENNLTDTIDEKLALIAPTLNAIAFGGDQPYLCQLQTLLRRCCHVNADMRLSGVDGLA
jgi:hypothetical protein